MTVNFKIALAERKAHHTYLALFDKLDNIVDSEVHNRRAFGDVLLLSLHTGCSTSAETRDLGFFRFRFVLAEQLECLRSYNNKNYELEW